MRSCSDVHNLLIQEGVPHEILHLPALSSTAQLAADLLGVPVREVVLAGSRQVLDLTGCRPGAVPPCVLSTEPPVVADPGVFEPEVVYCGGGTTTTMLKIRSADLEALIKPRRAAVAKRG